MDFITNLKQQFSELQNLSRKKNNLIELRERFGYDNGDNLNQSTYALEANEGIDKDKGMINGQFEQLNSELSNKNTVSNGLVGDQRLEIEGFMNRTSEMIKVSRDKELKVLEEYERTRQAQYNRNKSYCKTLEILVGKDGALWEYLNLHEQSQQNLNTSSSNIYKTDATQLSIVNTQKLDNVERLVKKQSEEWLWSKETFEKENDMIFDEKQLINLPEYSTLNMDDSKMKELVDKRVELENRVYVLETSLEEAESQRDELRKQCDEKEKAVANLQRKVSLLMCEHRSIEKNLTELEEILENQSKINVEKEREICQQKEKLTCASQQNQSGVNNTEADELVAGQTIENEDLRAHQTNSQILLKNMQREQKMVKEENREKERDMYTSPYSRRNDRSKDVRYTGKYNTSATIGRMSTVSNEGDSYYR